MNTGEVSGGQPAGPAADADGVVFELRLYIAGQSPKSVLAIENLRRVCDEHLPGRYRIEVIDPASKVADLAWLTVICAETGVAGLVAVGAASDATSSRFGCPTRTKPVHPSAQSVSTARPSGSSRSDVHS